MAAQRPARSLSLGSILMLVGLSTGCVAGELTEGASVTTEEVEWSSASNGPSSFGCDSSIITARAFLGVLGREPQLQATVTWGRKLADGASIVQLTAQLLASPEFAQTRGTLTAVELAQELYRGTLGRNADPGGLTSTTAAIEEGRAAQRAAAMLHSEEFKQRFLQAERILVNHAYYGILGRRPELDGLRHWSDRLAAGASLVELCQRFFTSAEFEKDRSQLSATELATQLYAGILASPPDPLGLAHTVQMIDEGKAAQRAAAMLASPELAQRFLTPCAQPPPCVMPDANGNGDAADDLQAMLDKQEDLNLCESQTFHLMTRQCGEHFALCFKAAGQKIYTNHFPDAETGTSSAAILKIAHAGVPCILKGSVSDTRLSSVILDGNRGALGFVANRPALVQMGLGASGQVIEHNLFRDTRTWSTLQVHEGNLTCNDVTVAHNRIEDAGCDRNGSGCAAGDAAKTWADGISYACQNGSVHDNVIVNATDGGIVLFAPRGTEVYGNTVRAVDRIMLGGINLVDAMTFETTIDGATYADYSNVRVHDNTIDASGNRIDVGIAQGNRVWGCSPFEWPLHGASVTHNTFRGAQLGWGAAIDGVHDWTFDGNVFDATFNGSSRAGCGGTIPAPTDCRRHATHVTGASALQGQCADVPSGYNLHGVLVSN